MLKEGNKKLKLPNYVIYWSTGSLYDIKNDEELSPVESVVTLSHVIVYFFS